MFGRQHLFLNGKKHRGYVGNVVETFDDMGTIITGMCYKPNIQSDFFCKEVMTEESWQEERVIFITDGAYGSDQTKEPAKETQQNECLQSCGADITLFAFGVSFPDIFIG